MGRPQSLQKIMPGLWQIVRHFWPQIQKQRALLAGSMLALVVEVVFRLLEPWPLKIVFDYVIVHKPASRPSRTSVLDALDPTHLLVLSVLAIIGITGLRALAAYWSTVGFALAGNRVLTEVRRRLYRHIQYLSLSFHNKARSGDLIVRVIGDVGMLRDVIVTALLPLLGKILVLIGMLLLMFYLNWKLTLLALSVLPLFWLRTVHLSRRIQVVARHQRQREGALAATTAESIAAIKTVQALSLENTFAEVFSSENKRSSKEGVKAKRLEARLERSVDVIVAISAALVLGYGAHLVLRGFLSPGDLLVFLAYLKNAFRPAQDFAKYTGRLAKATAAGERILDLLTRTPEVRELPGAIAAQPFRGQVRFEGVTFAYEPGRNSLERIDLEVQPGQHVALVGPSGGGKSTLVSLLSRLYDPVQGCVSVDGIDIRRYTLDSLRSQIGVVLQESLLFASSVRDNIAYGAPEATDEEIIACAGLANARGFIEGLPMGYDTVLGERGVTLSQGQRQRIAIARAAVRKAPIYIFDEPTTGLDEGNACEVSEALERLALDRTVFLITHDLSVAARAHLIVYLENGKIVERGTHADLIQAGGRYASQYRLQSARIEVTA